MVAATEPDADRPFAPGRPRFEVLLVAIGVAVQVGITSVAARHQPLRRDFDAYGIALLALGVAALPLRRTGDSDEAAAASCARALRSVMAPSYPRLDA